MGAVMLSGWTPPRTRPRQPAKHLDIPHARRAEYDLTPDASLVLAGCVSRLVNPLSMTARIGVIKYSLTKQKDESGFRVFRAFRG
jgi:hypothetical protein